MSLVDLRKALTEMPATGEAGFEGLAALLLGALTKEKFYIARSGDQPADAVSFSNAYAIQGKRYDRTPLDETEFEGDFHKACRTIPNLDCYILAATRTTAQLLGLVRELEQRSGVDILLLGIGGNETELAALCITYWDDIKHFSNLAELPSEFGDWAKNEASKTVTIEAITRISNVLTHSSALSAKIKERLNSYLNTRFGIQSAASQPSRFRIDLLNAVNRSKPVNALERWWEKGKTSTALLLGEEGMGKSWVAAAFAAKISLKPDSFVLWLDSADWTKLSAINEVIENGFKQAGFGQGELRSRLTRKAGERWGRALLVVLDGINERGAKETAHLLLKEIFASEKPPCRILFTSRPIDWTSDESALWRSVVEVGVERFTEVELCEALSRLPVFVSRDEISGGLANIAKIPRYFHRAIELRERFKSLTNVTKTMVLWADLIAKIEERDGQMVGIGLRSAKDIKRVLMKIASEAKSLGVKLYESVETYALLQSVFGHRFEEIRADLVEQRILIEPEGGNLTPSAEHVVLGFALYLGQIAGQDSGSSVRDLADKIKKELEPSLAQDQLTEALFVALQLSAFPNANWHRLTANARAALLFAWVSSQNARFDLARLAFWAQEDLTAYLAFVEEIYVESVSDGWTKYIVNPLAELWQQENAETESPDLNSRLRQWLKLTWRSPNLPKTCYQGECLPLAKSQDQLNLSFVAIAVISENPSNSFLPDLAIAWATDGLSVERKVFPKQKNENADKVYEFKCKQIGCNIGALMRWSFCEVSKNAVKELLDKSGEDPTLSKGCEWLLDSLDTFGWRRTVQYEKLLAEGKSLFSDAVEDCAKHFSNCPELAVRCDIPELCDFDRKIVALKVERAFPLLAEQHGYSNTVEHAEMERHLSWFAKVYPSNLVRLGTDFRMRVLDLEGAAPALRFSNLLPFSGESKLLLKKLMSCAERMHKGSEVRNNWLLDEIHVCAFTCLEEEDLKSWLHFSIGLPALREAIHIYPNPLLYPYVVSDSMASFARNEARKSVEMRGSDAGDNSVFTFWATIGALAGAPDPSFHDWVNERIKLVSNTAQDLFYWLSLWLRSAGEDQFKALFVGDTVRKLWGDKLWRAMYHTNRWGYEWVTLPDDFDRAIRMLPLNGVGTVFFCSQRFEDLDRWGYLVFAQAMELVGKPPFERQYWGQTILTTDGSGFVVGSTCETSNSPDDRQDLLRPPSLDEISKSKRLTAEEYEIRLNSALSMWKQDRERLKESIAEIFDNFGACTALAKWRDRQPEVFLLCAKNLLDSSVSTPEKSHHIGSFLVEVINALIPLDPDYSWKMDILLRESAFRLLVTNEYGLRTFDVAAWTASISRRPENIRLCRNLLETSSTDDELMRHSIAALSVGAGDVLLQICEDLLKNGEPKDRCLAVSVLPWIADESSLEILKKCETLDASGWVRRHAEWGIEMAKQEKASRTWYSHMLKETDRNKLLSMCQVLTPALTPSALWWRHNLEEEAKANERLPSDVKAALVLFGTTRRVLVRSLQNFLAVN